MSTMDDKQLDALLCDAFADVKAPPSTVERTRAAVRDQAEAGAGVVCGQAPVSLRSAQSHAAVQKEPAPEMLAAEEAAPEVLATETPEPDAAAASLRTSSSRVKRRHWQYVAALAACLLAIVIIPLGIHAFRDVTTVVSIDVNPSVELSLNRFDRVVSARGMNDDGDALLEAVSVDGLTCDDAVQALLASDAVQRAATKENPVEVVVSSLDGSDTSKLEEQLNRACASTGCAVQCSSAQADEHAAASELGLTVGKYRIYETLHAHGCDVGADEVASMTMRELRDLAAQYGCDDLEGDGSGAGPHAGAGCGNSYGMGGANARFDQDEGAAASGGNAKGARKRAGDCG
ncbi:MAG: hypothetical protein SOI38_03380 [Eggerthellaceae bacterium]|jgi:hypothetical protein